MSNTPSTHLLLIVAHGGRRLAADYKWTSLWNTNGFRHESLINISIIIAFFFFSSFLIAFVCIIFSAILNGKLHTAQRVHTSTEIDENWSMNWNATCIWQQLTAYVAIMVHIHTATQSICRYGSIQWTMDGDTYFDFDIFVVDWKIDHN